MGFKTNLAIGVILTLDAVVAAACGEAAKPDITAGEKATPPTAVEESPRDLSAEAYGLVFTPTPVPPNFLIQENSFVYAAGILNENGKAAPEISALFDNTGGLGNIVGKLYHLNGPNNPEGTLLAQSSLQLAANNSGKIDIKGFELSPGIDYNLRVDYTNPATGEIIQTFNFSKYVPRAAELQFNAVYDKDGKEVKLAFANASKDPRDKSAENVSIEFLYQGKSSGQLNRNGTSFTPNSSIEGVVPIKDIEKAINRELGPGTHEITAQIKYHDGFQERSYTKTFVVDVPSPPPTATPQPTPTPVPLEVIVKGEIPKKININLETIQYEPIEFKSKIGKTDFSVEDIFWRVQYELYGRVPEKVLTMDGREVSKLNFDPMHNDQFVKENGGQSGNGSVGHKSILAANGKEVKIFYLAINLDDTRYKPVKKREIYQVLETMFHEDGHANITRREEELKTNLPVENAHHEGLAFAYETAGMRHLERYGLTAHLSKDTEKNRTIISDLVESMGVEPRNDYPFRDHEIGRRSYWNAVLNDPKLSQIVLQRKLTPEEIIEFNAKLIKNPDKFKIVAKLEQEQLQMVKTAYLNRLIGGNNNYGGYSIFTSNRMP